MCTLGYELDRYFSKNSLDCCHPSSICIKTYPLYRGRHPALYNTTVENLCNDFINGQGECYLKKKYHPNDPVDCQKNKKGGCYCGIQKV